MFMWLRFHTPPKACRTDYLGMTPRQAYYYKASYLRYKRANDCQKLDEIAVKASPKVGAYEGVRFIESP